MSLPCSYGVCAQLHDCYGSIFVRAGHYTSGEHKSLPKSSGGLAEGMQNDCSDDLVDHGQRFHDRSKLLLHTGIADQILSKFQQKDRAKYRKTTIASERRQTPD